MTRLPAISGIFKPNRNQDGLFELTEAQKVRFEDFLELLDSSDTAGKVRILYRGENLISLQEKLGADTRTPKGLSDLYKKCFFLGDKAKGFLLTGNATAPVRNWDFNIGEVRDKDFEFIFNETEKLVTSSKAYTFSQTEDDFFNYFSYPQNLDDFILKTSSIPNHKDKLIVRDYFLWILHNLGSESFKSSSYFISTTSDLNTATACAHDKGREAGPVVFLYFIPLPTEFFGLNLSNITNAVSKISELSLPTYSSSIYEENETSLKGALFPHFIFGIYEFTTCKFIINKHFFEKENLSLSFIQNNGLKIDQEVFAEFIKTTNYENGVETNCTGTFGIA